MKSRPQLNHLGLYTADMAAMERFYVDVMGLIVTDRGKVPRLGNVDIVFMSAHKNAHHQIAIIGKPEQKGPSCVNQIAFKVQALQELREMNQRFLAAAVSPVQPIDHGNAWSIYTSDPDGNGVEVYLDTPWHVAQPHSRPLDFALGDEAILRNTEAAVRKDPTFKSLAAWSDEMSARLD
ncbi:MAG: VOC family protein [Pseudomonadota bacterium]